MAVVVVVDDQASAREMMRLLVKGIHESIEVQEFWDAEQALEWCCLHSPELVLLDYRMPSIDGVTFAERLRDCCTGQHTAVMMITSMGDASIRMAALQAGVVEFVTKPIVPQEIKLRVRNLLELASRSKVEGVASLPPLATTQQRNLAIEALGRMMSVLRSNGSVCAHEVLSVEHVVTGMAAAMKLDADTKAKAQLASRVYDIGMALLPDRTVEKKRALTSDEKECMHAHPKLARDLLIDIDAEIAEIVFRHHEHFNGSGYPDGLIGSAIPSISRMLSVADTFCSLISKRPHRDAYRISEAVGSISAQSGTTFDPNCVDALVEAVPLLLGKTNSLPAREVAAVGGRVR